MSRTRRRGYVSRVIRMNALRKGLLGGNPFWRMVWFAGVARRVVGRISKRGPAPIAFVEPLEEGRAWSLVHVPERSRHGRKLFDAPSAARINEILGREAMVEPPPTRRERRQAKRAARRAADREAPREAA